MYRSLDELQADLDLDDAVSVGPVSSSNSQPTAKLINREFCHFGALRGDFRCGRRAKSMACSKIPNATEQGLYLDVNRELFSPNREFFRPKEICIDYACCNAQGGANSKTSPRMTKTNKAETLCWQQSWRVLLPNAVGPKETRNHPSFAIPGQRPIALFTRDTQSERSSLVCLCGSCARQGKELLAGCDLTHWTSVIAADFSAHSFAGIILL
jgi:hypothetical protein